MTLKLTKPTMMCEGGPWDGWAYHVEDWERRQRAFANADNPICGYYVPDIVHTEDGREVVRKEIHPLTGASRGGQLSERWVWRPPEDYDDPYKARPVSDKRAEVIRTVASLGRRGAQLAGIAAAMPWQCHPRQITSVVDELLREGVLEASSDGPNPWYRYR